MISPARVTAVLLAVWLLACWTVSMPTVCAQQSLFNGVDLTGWQVVGGGGSFQVENGVIVGRSVPNSPNTFLITNDEYRDFVLDVEFQIDDTSFNSGVQLRSQTLPSHNNGRLFGYQADIDPSSRAWTGGIYFEGGSPQRPAGWLDDLTDNPAAQAAFVLGEWNHFRIEAKGRSLRTWLNGVPAADYVDPDPLAFMPEGVIGLQVHAHPSLVPLEVRWRNIVVEEIDFALGDLNQNGALDVDDWLRLVDNLYLDAVGLGPSDVYFRGDLNGDMVIDFFDLQLFRDVYPGPPTDLVVPEPTGAAMMIVWLLLRGPWLRRQGWRRRVGHEGY